MVVTSICVESSEDLRSSPINMWRIIGGLKVMSNLGPYETDDDPMENLYLIQERGLPWELGSLDHNVTCLHMWPTLLERNSHLWEETITINIRVLSYILLMWWLFICKTANEQIFNNQRDSKWHCPKIRLNTTKLICWMLGKQLTFGEVHPYRKHSIDSTRTLHFFRQNK